MDIYEWVACGLGAIVATIIFGLWMALGRCVGLLAIILAATIATAAIAAPKVYQATIRLNGVDVPVELTLDLGDEPEPPPDDEPPPPPPPVSDGFPIDLFENGEGEATAFLTLNAAPTLPIAVVTLTAFDPDQPSEGELRVNGSAPVALFGPEHPNADSEQATVVLEMPAAAWRAGRNELRFRHLATSGFRVLGASVAFKGGDDPAPPPPPDDDPDPPAPPVGGDFFVAPTATASGSGSASNPWRLEDAFAEAPSGSTVAIQPGTYRSSARHEVRADGVHFRGYGARIVTTWSADNNDSAVTIKGDGITLEGLEILCDETDVSGDRSEGRPLSAISDSGANNRVLHCYLHGCIQGIESFSGATGGLYAGNIVYDNGRLPRSSRDNQRPHGHGIYTQNSADTPKVYRANVSLFSAGECMRSYTQGGDIRNVHWIGNTTFGPSYGWWPAIGGAVTDQAVGLRVQKTDSEGVDGIRVERHRNYILPGNDSAGVIFNGGAGQLIVRDCLFAAPIGRPEFGAWDGTVDTTGTEAVRYEVSKPIGQDVFVEESPVRPDWRLVTVFNWDGEASVNVDTGLPSGQYVVRNVQNLGETVATFAGGSVSIPLNPRSVTPPIGRQVTEHPATLPRFGCFIVCDQNYPW